MVENRAGAGGIVGTAYVAKTPPDGYTWLVTTASHVNTPPFNKNVPFDPVKDFAHVTLIAQNFGQALIVPAGSLGEDRAGPDRGSAPEPGQAQLRLGRHRHGEPHPGRGDEVDDAAPTSWRCRTRASPK